jgi:hypothetical protein
MQHANTATRDRPHRKFFLSGKAEFADQQDIEPHIEPFRNDKTNRHTAARKREHDHIVASGIRCQPLRKQFACFCPIPVSPVTVHCTTAAMKTALIKQSSASDSNVLDQIRMQSLRSASGRKSDMTRVKDSAKSRLFFKKSG